MSKRKSSKSKLKKSLSHIIRKVFIENPSSTLSHKQVCSLIDVRDKAHRKLVYSVLEDLVKSRFLRAAGHGIYCLSEQNNFAEGILQLTARGSGFVVIEGEDDIFVSSSNLQQAMDGDRVSVQITHHRKQGRREGVIVNVLERERTQFVGTIHLEEKYAFLLPDNTRVGTDIFIPKEKLNNAKHGEKALVRITAWPKSANNPFGEVLEVLGKTGGNDVEMISILVNQGIDYQFPDDVLSQAEVIGVQLEKEELKKRRDFRAIPTFTIDPEDAKDFDDALSFQYLENGRIEIGIHIADVSHYVTPNTPMDAEALKRSNSVYLVDRVIPMLPEQLSNMACSLRPNEDKYSFSVVVEMDESGKIYNKWFGKTVIHSNHRFTYEEAQEIIEGKEGVFQKELVFLDKIAKILRNKRLDSGAMNIESEEVRFRLNEEGMPYALMLKRSKDAHKLIEEFMLLANRLVATYLTKISKTEKMRTQCVYRCHDKPNEEKIGLFNLFIQKFGYNIDLQDTARFSSKINALLKDIRFENEYSLIQTMAIRSMAKATYETVNIGHYGLAFDHYTHFTSPIRRYADLVVHRILHEELTKNKRQYRPELNDVCKRISRMERKAIDAERESTKYFQTLFVIDKIGQEFEGTVSGIAEFGLFVRMEENQCEGMVPIKDLPNDRFHFDVDNYVIVGAKTGKQYNFGDKVTVRITEVSPRKRQIDLEIVP